MDGAVLGVAAGMASVGAMGWAVRGRSSPVWGRSLYRGDRTQPRIALTFDDGPSRSTPALLEILEEQQVRPTFFMCGRNVRRHPAIAREVAAAKHCIGNHTDRHPYLHFHTPEFVFREIALAQESIHVTTGVTPRWFRAPYGVRWFGVGSAQARLGLTGVMWSLIGHDWRWPATRIARLLVNGTRNGEIVCLHDGRGLTPSPDIRPTLNAVEYAIPLLKERGFQFVTLDEMLCPKT
jgi:peptidoglycan/xylan/chitin deacetylase (PgdA/CDA1 family)